MSFRYGFFGEGVSVPPENSPTPEAAPKDAVMSKVWEWAKDALAIAVLPLLAWVINLSVQNAQRDDHIQELQKEVDGLHEEQKEVATVKDDLQKSNLQMVRLEGKIDLANGRLDEIKSLLHP